MMEKPVNLALLGAALVVGLLVGFAASSLAYRYHLMRPPGEAMLQRMVRVLKLTPAQRDQVEEMMQDTRFRAEQLRRDCRHQHRQLVRQARQQIRTLLAPAQQADFDRYFAERGERHADKGPP